MNGTHVPLLGTRNASHLTLSLLLLRPLRPRRRPCCSVGYWVLCYPLDIIKSAMQTDSIFPDQRRYRTLPGTASLLWAEGGAGRFFLGFTPCLVRSFPANAAGFLCYEVAKRAMDGS